MTGTDLAAKQPAWNRTSITTNVRAHTYLSNTQKATDIMDIVVTNELEMFMEVTSMDEG